MISVAAPHSKLIAGVAGLCSVACSLPPAHPVTLPLQFSLQSPPCASALLCSPVSAAESLDFVSILAGDLPLSHHVSHHDLLSCNHLSSCSTLHYVWLVFGPPSHTLGAWFHTLVVARFHNLVVAQFHNLVVVWFHTLEAWFHTLMA